MKFVTLALAFLAIFGVVVQPIAPAYAVTSDTLSAGANRHTLSDPRLILAEQTLDEFILNAQIGADVRQKLAAHAARGEAAVLSRAQMDDLARTHPALYAKLMGAYRTASPPNLTAQEKKLVDRLTAANIEAFKAGQPEPTGCSPASPSPASLPGTVRVASAERLATTGTFNENCSSSNMTAAWVILGFVLTVIIAVPLFCAIATQLGTAPAFCRGMSGP